MPADRDDLQPIRSYYEQFAEQERLSSSWGQLEFVRSLDILERFLPPAPAVVLDVGGAAGRYACWLARGGYEVHLIDPVAKLVEQARQASARQAEMPIASCQVGDVRELDFPDVTADAILCFGPLYHLVERRERLRALAEALRVLKPGGRLFAVGICRFASVVDGLVGGFLADPVFREIVARDLTDGQHRNPTENLAYFTDAYFHRPEELRAEIEQAGFQQEQLLAVDGVGAVLADLDDLWRDEERREHLLGLLRLLESEPALLGVSPHIMCIARRPAPTGHSDS